MRLFGYLIAHLAVAIFVLTISLLRADTLHKGVKTSVDLLFVVGALIAGFGALFYIGKSRPSYREWHAHSVGEKGTRKQVEIYSKYREMQRRHGLIVILFGLALIGLAIAIDLVFGA